MLSKCEEKKDPKTELILMDAKKIEFPDESFDTVVGTFVLGSNDEPNKIMSEMARVCKKDGKILILDRGRALDLLTMVLLNLYRYEYLFTYGYDQCANIKEIVESAPVNIETQEVKQGGHIYFYILTKK